MVSVTSPRTSRAHPMTGVISALPVNHRVGGSLENLILKISSRVNDRHCLWGKLLSSMIRYRLNVTIVRLILRWAGNWFPVFITWPFTWDTLIFHVHWCPPSKSLYKFAILAKKSAGRTYSPWECAAVKQFTNLIANEEISRVSCSVRVPHTFKFWEIWSSWNMASLLNMQCIPLEGWWFSINYYTERQKKLITSSGRRSL